MANTITIGNTQVDPHGPKIPAVPVFYTRSSFSLPWQPEPFLEFAGCTISSAGHGESACEVEYSYGNKKWITDTEHTITRPKINMMNKYFRMDFVSGTVHRVVFTGIIREDVRTVKGTKEYDGVKTELGRQHFVAYGPESMLEKHDISSSYWLSGGQRTQVEWIPAMNLRDSRGRLVGNRTANYVGYSFDASASLQGGFIPRGSSYHYGGNKLWSHYDYLEYVILNHLPRVCNWYIGGQANLLKKLYSSIEFEEVESARKKLGKLIPLNYGIDYHLFPVDDGYVIHVYSRNPYDIYFGVWNTGQAWDTGNFLHGNPDHLIVKTTSEVGLIYNILVEKTQHFRYSGVRLIGKRSLICASPAMLPQWTEELQDAYLQGTGEEGDTADKHDAVRKQDRFDHVFQRFAAEAGWTLSRQAAVRETMDWLPLREGYDYSAGPPINNNPAGIVPGYMRATAWIKHPGLNVYVPVAKGLNAEATGANISALDNDWGLLIEPSINHIYGANHVGTDLTTYPSNKTPQFDYETLVATIAFKGDTRLQLQYLSSGGDGSVKEVYDRTAEVWYLAPNTIVGIAEDGSLLDSGSNWRVLRDDTEFLSLKMCGLIATYLTDRARAIISAQHLYAASYYIGKMLIVIDGSSDIQTVQSPITNVQFTRDGRTIFRSGYAQS